MAHERDTVVHCMLSDVPPPPKLPISAKKGNTLTSKAPPARQQPKQQAKATPKQPARLQNRKKVAARAGRRVIFRTIWMGFEWFWGIRREDQGKKQCEKMPKASRI